MRISGVAPVMPETRPVSSLTVSLGAAQAAAASVIVKTAKNEVERMGLLVVRSTSISNKGTNCGYWPGGGTRLGWIEMLVVSFAPSMVTTTGTLSPVATPGG